MSAGPRRRWRSTIVAVDPGPTSTADRVNRAEGASAEETDTISIGIATVTPAAMVMRTPPCRKAVLSARTASPEPSASVEATTALEPT